MAQAYAAKRLGVTPQHLNAVEHLRVKDDNLVERARKLYEKVALRKALANGTITAGPQV